MTVIDESLDSCPWRSQLAGLHIVPIPHLSSRLEVYHGSKANLHTDRHTFILDMSATKEQSSGVHLLHSRTSSHTKQRVKSPQAVGIHLPAAKEEEVGVGGEMGCDGPPVASTLW